MNRKDCLVCGGGVIVRRLMLTDAQGLTLDCVGLCLECWLEMKDTIRRETTLDEITGWRR